MDSALSTKLITIGFLTLCSAALLAAAAGNVLAGRQRAAQPQSNTPFTYVLPLLQFFFGVSLLIPALHPWGKFGAGILFAIVGIAQAQALARGIDSGLRFWGAFSSWQLSWGQVARNWVIAAILFFAIPSSSTMYLSENGSSALALAVSVGIVYLLMANRYFTTPRAQRQLHPAC